MTPNRPKTGVPSESKPQETPEPEPAEPEPAGPEPAGPDRPVSRRTALTVIIVNVYSYSHYSKCILVQSQCTLHTVQSPE